MAINPFIVLECDSCRAVAKVPRTTDAKVARAAAVKAGWSRSEGNAWDWCRKCTQANRALHAEIAARKRREALQSGEAWIRPRRRKEVQ